MLQLPKEERDVQFTKNFEDKTEAERLYQLSVNGKFKKGLCSYFDIMQSGCRIRCRGVTYIYRHFGDRYCTGYTNSGVLPKRKHFDKNFYRRQDIDLTQLYAEQEKKRKK